MPASNGRYEKEQGARRLRFLHRQQLKEVNMQKLLIPALAALAVTLCPSLAAAGGNDAAAGAAAGAVTGAIVGGAVGSAAGRSASEPDTVIVQPEERCKETTVKREDMAGNSTTVRRTDCP
jgi:uncharacterized protein YcfJ